MQSGVVIVVLSELKLKHVCLIIEERHLEIRLNLEAFCLFNDQQ